jgi:hypothetical protein
MTPDDASPRPAFPLARAYMILCAAALFVLALALIENDRDLLSVLVLAGLGALFLLARFRAGPPLLIAGLVLLEVVHRWQRPWAFRGQPYGLDESPVMDAVMCAAVLAYAGGMYRLFALTHSVLPVDFRQPPPPAEGRRAPPHDGRRPRSAGAAGHLELATLAAAAVLVAAAATVLWLVLSAADSPQQWDTAYLDAGLSPRTARYGWRVVLLLWGVVLSAAVVGGAAAYFLWTTSPPEAHRVYLQDQAWLETRRDLTRVGRFLAWARLRGQRRREKKPPEEKH